MTAALRIPPAPVGQQEPPARAAASDSWRSLRDARGALRLTTRTACRRDKQQEDNILRQDARSWHEAIGLACAGQASPSARTQPAAPRTGNGRAAISKARPPGSRRTNIMLDEAREH